VVDILIVGSLQEVDLKDLWVSLSGAIAQQKNVETIANNVANANSPGFKRDQLVFKEQLAALDGKINDVDLPRKEWAPEDFYRSYGAEDAHVQVQASFTDFSQGQMEPTGNQLDIAIMGKGFFELLTPNGLRYSRAGNFTIDREGRLVNENGFFVLSKEAGAGNNQTELPPGDNRIVRVGNGQFSINSNGEMFSDRVSLGNISVVEFK